MQHKLPAFEKGQFGFVDVPFSLMAAGNIDNEICDDLVNFYETDTYFMKSDGEAAGKVDKKIKNSQDISVPINCTHPAVRGYLEALDFCAYKYARMFPPIAQADFRVTKFFNIQKYPKGGGYFEWHAERLSNELDVVSRVLVFMTYLNDVTDKGETEFFMQNLSVEPKKGLTLIWPSEWSHTHRGVPSPSQEKIIVTGWFELKIQKGARNKWLLEILEKENLNKKD